MSVTREFLGWDEPFGRATIDWLWERRARLSGMLLVVPTAQSGRRLREGLAERGGVLAPRVVTSGFFSPEGKPPEAVEILAWVEVLEKMNDWSQFEAAFPMPPGADEAPGWSLGLAKSLARMRTQLQEGGLSIKGAAKLMSDSVEAERWMALAELEGKVDGLLSTWNYGDRVAFSLPRGVDEVVIAGVADLPERAALALKNAEVTVLVAGEESEHFDEWGRPTKEWSDAEISWPHVDLVDLVHLEGEPMQQAEKALELIAQEGRSSDEIALGSADDEVSRELVKVFGRAGWPVFDPGSRKVPSLVKWLKAWRSYLRSSGSSEALDLLGFSQSGALVKGKRAQRARELAKLRNERMVRHAQDVTQAKEKELRCDVELVEETMASLENSRSIFLGQGFHKGMRSLLPIIDPEDELSLLNWLDDTAGVAKEVKRGPGFWLDLLLAGIASVEDGVPDERVLDVQGWLELFFEEGPHLVMCGMNEGLIPARESSDAWLPEATRRRLGLSSSESRAARDAFLLTSLIRSRESSGRVDLILGKVSAGGDVMIPSRLLLAAKGEELARRVKLLFRNIEPSDSGLAFTLEDEWKWRPQVGVGKARMSVSSFSGYLSCPYRFYLKQVLYLRDSDSERLEWSARDFGNIAHQVLEAWALDREARALDSGKALEAWVHTQLDVEVAQQFGDEIPMAIRIQREAMRQRLSWFAEQQAIIYEEGWRVVEAEKNFEIEIGGMPVRGQVDRIDEHLDGRIRVLDYKTKAKPVPVATAHKKTSRSKRPVHLDEVEAADFDGGFWSNLQVPLYAAGLKKQDGIDVQEIGYFALGATKASVKVDLWKDFDEGVVESALICAEWVISQIQAGVFWPPAERSLDTDFDVLALGRTLDETTQWEGGDDE